MIDETAREVDAAPGLEGGGEVRLAAGRLGRRQRQVRASRERAGLPCRRPQLVLLLPGMGRFRTFFECKILSGHWVQCDPSARFRNVDIVLSVAMVATI